MRKNTTFRINWGKEISEIFQEESIEMKQKRHIQIGSTILNLGKYYYYKKKHQEIK